MAEWEILDTNEPPPAPPAVHGEEVGAELRVEVHTYDDGERIVTLECMCAACWQLNEVGLEDSMPDLEGLLEDGVHFLKYKHVEFRTFEYVEHDTYLVHNTEDTDG